MQKGNRVIYMDSLKENFDKIYVTYFSRMFHFAKEYVLFDEDAENIVQDIFMFLWEKRDVLNVELSLSAYLFTLVKNKCLDHLRHKMITEEYSKNIQNDYVDELNMKLYSLEIFNSDFSTENDVERILSEAINKLPPKCRAIFVKSRIEGKKYREIAEELHISVNTVEGQMSIALKKLRVELKDYLPLFFFFLW